MSTIRPPFLWGYGLRLSELVNSDTKTAPAKHTEELGAGSRRVPTDVVIVPPGGDPAKGFDCARKLLREGGTVSLVGDGVTLPLVMPAWAHEESGLLLTELGTYRVDDGPSAVHDVHRGVRLLLESTVGFSKETKWMSEALFGNALMRLFQPYLMLSPAVHGLVERHGPIRYHLTAECPSAEQLRALVEVAGGHLVDVPRPNRAWAFFRLSFWGLVVLLGTVLFHAVRYSKESSSRRKLKSLRVNRGGDRPRLWVVLAPDWGRINRHLLDSVAIPALERGESPGVLLFGSLRLGMRSEATLQHHVGGQLWPALGPLQARLNPGSVDQIVSAESLAQLASTTLRAIPISLVALARVAWTFGYVNAAGLQFHLGNYAKQLAKLFTHDVLSALLAEGATRRVVGRHDFSGTTIVFPGLIQLASEVVADRILREAGAITVDYVHGSFAGTWLWVTPNHASVRCVWTEPDAAANRYVGVERVEVVAAPFTNTINQVRPSRPPRNILITSNYAHRDYRINDADPFLAFQDELLRIVPTLRQTFGERFRFRWRPHPADSPAAIEKTAARYPGIELSRGGDLPSDLDWADVLISNMSTVATEGLLAGIPVFLHLLPAQEDFFEAAAFDPSRRFFRAEQILKNFSACIDMLERADPAVLDPETRARRAILGTPDGSVTMDEWILRRIR